MISGIKQNCLDINRYLHLPEAYQKVHLLLGRLLRAFGTNPLYNPRKPSRSTIPVFTNENVIFALKEGIKFDLPIMYFTKPSKFQSSTLSYHKTLLVYIYGCHRTRNSGGNFLHANECNIASWIYTKCLIKKKSRTGLTAWHRRFEWEKKHNSTWNNKSIDCREFSWGNSKKLLKVFYYLLFCNIIFIQNSKLRILTWYPKMCSIVITTPNRFHQNKNF